MTIHFSYDKNKVIQALRYHFISRPEIRLMIILVNVFALTSAALFYFKKISSGSILIFSFLWFVLMISFWFVLPGLVYRRASTFKDHFFMHFTDEGFELGNERGSKSWPWKSLSTYMETPYFFHFYFDSKSFFLVPKEGFGSIEEMTQLRELLKNKVGKK